MSNLEDGYVGNLQNLSLIILPIHVYLFIVKQKNAIPTYFHKNINHSRKPNSAFIHNHTNEKTEFY